MFQVREGEDKGNFYFSKPNLHPEQEQHFMFKHVCKYDIVEWYV